MFVTNRFLGIEVADTERGALRDRFSGVSEVSVFRFSGKGHFWMASLEGVYRAVAGDDVNSCLT